MDQQALECAATREITQGLFAEKARPGNVDDEPADFGGRLKEHHVFGDRRFTFISRHPSQGDDFGGGRFT